MRPTVIKMLSDTFDIREDGLHKFIMRLKVDLLRLFTPEFLHFNVIFNQQK